MATNEHPPSRRGRWRRSTFRGGGGTACGSSCRPSPPWGLRIGEAGRGAPNWVQRSMPGRGALNRAEQCMHGRVCGACGVAACGESVQAHRRVPHGCMASSLSPGYECTSSGSRRINGWAAKSRRGLTVDDGRHLHKVLAQQAVEQRLVAVLPRQAAERASRSCAKHASAWLQQHRLHSMPCAVRHSPTIHAVPRAASWQQLCHPANWQQGGSKQAQQTVRRKLACLQLLQIQPLARVLVRDAAALNLCTV